MSWTEKKPNISGNLIIDGTIEGDQIKSDTALTLGGLTVDTDTLYVDSTNNRVGIGTTSAGSTLHVDSGTDDNIATFKSSDAGGYIQIQDNTTTALVGAGALGNELILYSNNSERLRIDSSGDVGIGTTAPERNLHVYMAESSCTPSTDAALFLEGQTSCSLQLGAYWAGVTSINFGAGGYSSPSQSDFDSGQIQYSNYSRYMAFKANGSEKMRLNASGYLGIGTTNPNVRLTVKNGSSGTGSSSSSTLFLDSTSSNYIQMGGSAGGFQGILFGDSNDNDVAFIQYYHGSNYMRFAVNAGERMRISSAGNVGIGTTAPTAKLDINADTIRLRSSKTPTSSSAQGYQGEICYDSNYMYICVAYNTWKRIPLETW
jgi:hypothetical protein